MSSSTPWQGEGGGDRSAGRIIEVATVLLLAIATVGSAWCAYQVSQWNGKETDAARTSAVLRIDASREFALATQKFSYDAAAAARYAEAYLAEDERLMTFLTTTLVRPEFLPLLEAWEAQVEAGDGAPGNLFENEEYIGELFAESTELDEASLAATLTSDAAGETADDYVLLTLFMASALFFAGVTASFSSGGMRLVLLAISAIILAVAGAQLVGLPLA